MKRLISQRHVVKQNILSLIGFCLVCYFGYHTVMGERSIMRLMTLDRQLAKATETYDRNHAARVALEDKVSRLRPGSIDPDLLEERAHYVLGYTRPDEQIILN
jgi:cell division protein FtsB